MQAGDSYNMHESGSGHRQVQAFILIQKALVSQKQGLHEG